MCEKARKIIQRKIADVADKQFESSDKQYIREQTMLLKILLELVREIIKAEKGG